MIRRVVGGGGKGKETFKRASLSLSAQDPWHVVQLEGAMKCSPAHYLYLKKQAGT